MNTITRYPPFNEVVSLREAMDRLFEDSVISSRSNHFGEQRAGNSNCYETAEGFTLQLPMPGVKAEDVEITVQQETLHVRWEYKGAFPEEANVHWQGYQAGQYQQSFSVPAPINADGVEAQYQDGILTLHLPKAEQARARTIKIQAKDTIGRIASSPNEGA